MWYVVLKKKEKKEGSKITMNHFNLVLGRHRWQKRNSNNNKRQKSLWLMLKKQPIFKINNSVVF